MLKIRLRRMGSNRRPTYRVVVSDGRKVPTSSVIEEVGFYDPRTHPEEFRLDHDRLRYWVERGAQMSESVRSLVKRVQS
jgi:small subunit ribosomal protein S16